MATQQSYHNEARPRNAEARARSLLASSASKKTKGETAEKPPASKRAAPDDSQPPPAPKRAAPAKAAASAIKNPAVPELTSHPFFDDATPSLLDPDNNTSMEREALRAVTTGNVELLRTHLVGKAPLDEERDVVLSLIHI